MPRWQTGNDHMVPLTEPNKWVLGGRLDAFGESESISFG